MRVTTIDILKFLHHEDTSSAMRQAIEVWLAESEENRLEFRLFEFIYSQSPALVSFPNFTLESKWNEMAQKVSAVKTEKSNLWKILIPVLIMMALIAGYFYFRSPFITVENQASFADLKKVVLPDESTVSLIGNGQLKYRKTFLTDTIRKVWLVGNAEFDITNRSEHPFIVESNGAGIEVLGTVFEIQQDTLHDISIISNHEGKVKCFELSNPDNQQILNQGDKASWDGSRFEYTPVQTPAFSKPKGKMHDLEHLINFFKTRFEHTVKMDPSITWSATDSVFYYEDQTLEKILRQLSQTAHIKYKKHALGYYKIDELGIKR